MVRGCENIILAHAWLFCLALPGSCLTRFAHFLASLCTFKGSAGGLLYQKLLFLFLFCLSRERKGRFRSVLVRFLSHPFAGLSLLLWQSAVGCQRVVEEVAWNHVTFESGYIVWSLPFTEVENVTKSLRDSSSHCLQHGRKIWLTWK